MRLLQTSTLVFQEFLSREIPPYAILSHTWGTEEITYQSMLGQPDQHLAGYKKIEMTCQLAKAAGLNYAWIDTCCIDKRSSAELTEAINSMFRWYKRSAICYVYLEDLPAGKPWADFGKCRWLTRGWTLQELIAPLNLNFYDGEWNFRITKMDSIDELASLTGVERNILLHKVPLSSVTVCERMSWAAQRETTRMEDMAYCLFGIFDVNMPLLYGEEERAFIRLQEEIIRTRGDLTIFAWRIPSSPEDQKILERSLYSGVLAQSPRWFYGSKHMVELPFQMMTEFGAENKGIKLDARFLFENIAGKSGKVCLLPLCLSNEGTGICIALRKCGPGVFVRSDPHILMKFDMCRWSMIWRHVRRYLLPELLEAELGDPPPPIWEWEVLLGYRRHIIEFILSKEMAIEQDSVWPQSIWDSQSQSFFLARSPELGGAAAHLLVRGIFTGSIHGTPYQTRVNCFVYALDWGQSRRPVQFTLLDPLQHGTIVNQLHDEFILYDYRSSAPLKQALQKYGILQNTRVAYSLHGSGHTLLISCVASIAEDKLLCKNPFWRLEFSSIIVPDYKVCAIVGKEWK